MNGLFLQGGGAKGAFEAGAVYALREAGLTFRVISGTSIGAINGYYLYMGQEEEMKRFYTESDLMSTAKDLVITDVVSNEMLIEQLHDLPYIGSAVQNFYVNYVHVEKRRVIEVQKDLAKEDKKEQLRAITASSLLPFSLPEGMSYVTPEEAAMKYGDRIMGPCFAADVTAGKYENRDLDGGILNNFFMEPFSKLKLDKLYLISLHDEFMIPDYLRQHYTNDQMIVIERETPFPWYSSLNFSQPFLRDLFWEGYKTAQKAL